MPAVTQQGSRTTLVVWTVVSSFIFVIATVMAIYFYVDKTQARDDARRLQERYKNAVAEGELNSAALAALLDARGTDPNLNSSMSAMQVALSQRQNLARIMAGQSIADDPNNASRAASAAEAAINRARTQLKMDQRALPADNLVAAVETLTNTLAARQNEVQDLNQQVKDTQGQLEKTVADTRAQIDQMSKTIEEIRAEQQAAVANVTSVTAAKDEQVGTIAADYEQQLSALRDQVTALQTANAEMGDRNRQLETEIDRVRRRLSDIRIDPTQAVTRQPDGRIIRLAGQNIAYIDLGAGDQVTPGLTFEVFDKAEGIPQPGDPTTDENLPAGKASIEVVRVGPTTSECRITRQQTGTVLSEGDLIVNLVYDKNTKYNFLVYGNFDLDRNNLATPQDAEVIKRLITQWGGIIATDLNVDTDFVVLGKEPEIPSATREELETDPVLKARYDAAVADAEAYDNIRARAVEYRIPILNQNRFLYLIGYYSQAKR